MMSFYTRNLSSDFFFLSATANLLFFSPDPHLSGRIAFFSLFNDPVHPRFMM